MLKGIFTLNILPRERYSSLLLSKTYFKNSLDFFCNSPYSLGVLFVFSPRYSIISVFMYLSDFILGSASMFDFKYNSGKSKTNSLISKLIVFRIYLALSNYILFNNGHTAFTGFPWLELCRTGVSLVHGKGKKFDLNRSELVVLLNSNSVGLGLSKPKVSPWKTIRSSQVEVFYYL